MVLSKKLLNSECHKTWEKQSWEVLGFSHFTLSWKRTFSGTLSGRGMTQVFVFPHPNLLARLWALLGFCRERPNKTRSLTKGVHAPCIHLQICRMLRDTAGRICLNHFVSASLKSQKTPNDTNTWSCETAGKTWPKEDASRRFPSCVTCPSANIWGKTAQSPEAAISQKGKTRKVQFKLGQGRVQDFSQGGPVAVWPQGGPEPLICSK